MCYVARLKGSMYLVNATLVATAQARTKCVSAFRGAPYFSCKFPYKVLL